MWSKSKLAKFVPVAEAIAGLSKDINRKVGAVILDDSYAVRSTGYNGFCKGADDTILERYDRPAKYLYTSHAEANAIAQAASSGTPTKGCAIVVCSLHPCATCARLIVQAGITAVYTQAPDMTKERWAAEFQAAANIFKECGVEVFTY